MASIKVRQYRVTFKSIKEGEIPCTSPVVKLFGKTENIVQKCAFENNSVVLSIYEDAIEGLQGTCIRFSVVCESCGKCPQKDGKLCFCNNFTDCEECQDCINGICVNRCPDKLCVNDKCVDCGVNSDCKNNQVCITGKCQCPPNLPYFNEETERCYGCENDGECGPCYRCVDGNCVKLSCHCDESQDKCVECTQSSHCTDPNHCCVGNKCVCCPGYIWDPVQNKCVEEPECTSDDGLEPCFHCVNGEIQPIICPDPDEVCTNGKCGPIPCEGPCDDATDCGPNCGCLDGQCVDCASLDCVTCAKTIGCKCVNGECEKDNDPCAQYSCETNCGDRPDCGCQEDGSCEEVECEGESTLAKNEEECKLEYNLESTVCCPCSPITLNNKFLSLQILPDATMRLSTSVEVRKGSVTTPLGILNLHRVDQDQYDDIMDNEEPTQGVVQVKATYIYETLSSGSPTGVFTTEEVTLAPSIDVAGVGFKTVNLITNIPGRQYPSGIRILRTINLTYTLISELTFESGCVYDQGTVIGTYQFTDAITESALATSINQDTPGQDSNVLYWIAKTLESDACRVPEAKWYKAPALENGSIGTFESTPFRKTYLTKLTPTTYTDFIDEPDENPGPSDNNGELFSGYFYKVATECACVNEATAYYESTCENPGRVVFCDPQVADILFDPCGRKITFNASFITDCLPNYDYYGDNADFVPDGAKLRYSIYANGSDTPLAGSTKIADINGLIYNAGQQFTATELIEFIEIKWSHDNCDECTLRIESDVDKDFPAYNVICEPSGATNTTFIITFTSWTDITSITVNGNIATPGSPTVSVTVVNGTTSLIGDVLFTGCPGTTPMDIQLPENCCDDLTVNLTQSTADCDGETYDFVAIASPSVPGTFSFSVNGVFASSNSTGLFSTAKNIGGNEPNIVSVNFDPTAPGCDNVVTSVEVDKTNTIVINSDQNDEIVTCGNADVFITYSLQGYTGSVTYTVTGAGTTTDTFTGVEDLVIQVDGEPNDTKFVTITDVAIADELGNDCIALSPAITELMWVEEPSITSVTFNVADACEGAAVTFVVNGTGSTATINATNFLGTVPTTVNVGQVYTVYVGSSTNDAIITVTSVSAGNCTETVNVGAAVNVVDAPEITDVEYVCQTPGNPSSDFDITVYATAGGGAGVIVIADEGNVVLAESPSGQYTGTIDASNGGDSVTVQFTLNGCVVTEVVPIVACGCDEDFEVEIKQGGLHIFSDSGCIGETSSYTTTVTDGNSPYNYEWRLDNPVSGTLLATTSGITYEFIAGVHTLYVIVTDDEGCQTTDSITVTGNAIPTVSIVGDTTPCLDAATVYSASFTNGPIASYQWKLDGVNTVTTATYSYTPADEDPHTISVIVSNSNGCTSTEATLVVTAGDCCETCAEDWTFVRSGVQFNRLKDSNNNVYLLAPLIEFECVDPGNPSAANDTAAANLETRLAALPGQCGTPVVTWESVNTGTSGQCLSETFELDPGDDSNNGIWFRGIHVNGTDYLTNTQILTSSLGVVSGYPTNKATSESIVEAFISFALNQEDIGAYLINFTFNGFIGMGFMPVSVEIEGIVGATIKFLYALDSNGTVIPVDINDVACLGLDAPFYKGKCIKVTVEDSSIVPFQLYNVGAIDPQDTATFVGPCNPV